MIDTIPAERLALFNTEPLLHGSHASFSEGVCALELVAYVAGEKFSDRPDCVCPVLGAFVRTWNDELPDDERNTLLRPVLPRLIGTRGSDRLAERRALMAGDWLVRIHTPTWLRLAKLDAQANTLAELPEITMTAQIPSIREPIEAAKIIAEAAAWATARTAAGTVARAVARTAVRTAAETAARAWATVRTVAGDAEIAIWTTAATVARAAAEAAAWATVGTVPRAIVGTTVEAALKKTRVALQHSALSLVDRMIEAREPTDA